jgi:hypothetical protein
MLKDYLLKQHDYSLTVTVSPLYVTVWKEPSASFTRKVRLEGMPLKAP